MIRVALLLSLLWPIGSMASEGDPLSLPAPSGCALEVEPAQRADAFEHCLKAAQAGDVQAQFALGQYFHDGKLTQTDPAAALHWFEQASLQGHAQAQWQLGLMFWRGEAVPPNRVQAYIVLKMASINGAEEAMDDTDQLASEMSREELLAANQVLAQLFRQYLHELREAPPVPAETAPSQAPSAPAITTPTP